MKAGILDLDFGEQVAANGEENGGDDGKDHKVGADAQVGHLDKSASESVNSVRKRVKTYKEGEKGREVSQGKQSSGKEEKRHDQEVDDELEPLHIFQERGYGSTQSCKENGNEKHKDQSQGQAGE